jgi:hypothetical protein
MRAEKMQISQSQLEMGEKKFLTQLQSQHHIFCTGKGILTTAKLKVYRVFCRINIQK